MPKNHPELTAERLRDLLSYDPETGEFIWKVERGAARIGAKAGAFDHYGYVCIKVFKKNYKAHRLAWLYVHGAWPENQIDHINGIPGDNRIANIREATNAENCQNKALQRNNKSGHHGINLDKRNGKWRVGICIARRVRYVGMFKELEDAVAARAAAKANIHQFQPTDRHLMSKEEN